MPSNKIYVVLILSFALVTSIWVLKRDTSSPAKTKSDDIVSIQDRSKGAINNDWKKILVSIDPKNQGQTATALNNGSEPDEATMTAQLSKDFLSQYLLLAKSGQEVTPEEVDKITQNVLASSQYTKTDGVVYTASNLRVSSKTDYATVKNYNDTLNQSLNQRNALIETKEDPMVILDTAIKASNPDELGKLDSIIVARKGIVVDLINMEVPKDAIELHLDVVNGYSNVLANLEAIRAAFTDPVMSFAGTSQYQAHTLELKDALTNLNAYFDQKFRANG